MTIIWTNLRIDKILGSWGKWTALPRSHGVHGLPQAAPSEEQHWDFRVAPLIFISHLPSTMFCQQVPLTVSVGKKTPMYCHADCLALYINIFANTLEFNHEKESSFHYDLPHQIWIYPSLCWTIAWNHPSTEPFANPSLCLLTLTGNLSTPFKIWVIVFIMTQIRSTCRRTG